MVKRIQCEGRPIMSQITQGAVCVGYDMDGMWRIETMEEEWKWRVRPMS